MNEAAPFGLVDVATALAEELRRAFDDAGRRGLGAFRIVAEGRRVSIACGRDEDRRGGAMAARGAAAVTKMEGAVDQAHAS